MKTSETFPIVSHEIGRFHVFMIALHCTNALRYRYIFSRFLMSCPLTIVKFEYSTSVFLLFDFFYNEQRIILIIKIWWRWIDYFRIGVEAAAKPSRPDPGPSPRFQRKEYTKPSPEPSPVFRRKNNSSSSLISRSSSM